MTFRQLIDEYAVSAAVYGIVAGISAIAEWATFFEKFLIDRTAVECVEPDLTNQAILRGLGLKVAGSTGELGNNRYCLAYSINVLEHLEELEWYLGELNRVLHPGGVLFVFYPLLMFSGHLSIMRWGMLGDSHAKCWSPPSCRQTLRWCRCDTLTHLDSLLPLPFACSKNLVCSSTRPVPWGFTTEEFSQLAGSVTAYLEASLVKTYIVF